MGEGELEETQKEVEQELAELDDGQLQVDNLPGIQFSNMHLCNMMVIVAARRQRERGC